jgi:hypothetical protein
MYVRRNSKQTAVWRLILIILMIPETDDRFGTSALHFPHTCVCIDTHTHTHTQTLRVPHITISKRKM